MPGSDDDAEPPGTRVPAPGNVGAGGATGVLEVPGLPPPPPPPQEERNRPVSSSRRARVM